MKTLIPALAAAILLSAAHAENLAVGSPAPPLACGEFVQGEAVKELEKGKTYLVEFWATWCGPCVKAIPHVNELQKKYADKGLVVIGQNVWERDEAKVKPFIEKMGEDMTYRVALDDKSDGGKGKMAETWMQAAGQRGIPAAFVVNGEGVIAWIGHPATLTEETLGQIIDGSFDTAAQAEKAKQESERRDAIQGTMEKFKNALNERDMEKAEAAVAELEALNDPRVNLYLPMMRMDIAVKSKDGKTAGEHALAMLASAKQMQNKTQAVYTLTQFASQLNNAEGMEGLDRKIPVQLAEEASSLAGGNNPAVLSTLARAKFLAGDKEGAVAAQEEAIKHSEKEEQKAKLQETLDSYKE
jgi:thiol-disulfide isomerase/thioredoxin